jgi:hypothetical protein
MTLQQVGALISTVDDHGEAVNHRIQLASPCMQRVDNLISTPR